MDTLLPLAGRVADLLRRRGETLAVAESAAGGLISAALLALPGASAWYLGGAVIYTATARIALLGIDATAMAGLRSASEPYAALLAGRVRTRFAAGWGLAETGAAGPSGNRYGDPPGHACLAVAGASPQVVTLATGSADAPPTCANSPPPLSRCSPPGSKRHDPPQPIRSTRPFQRRHPCDRPVTRSLDAPRPLGQIGCRSRPVVPPGLLHREPA